MESMLTDLIDLLDGLEIPSAHLFGVSMGGIIACKCASLHPDRVRKLILISTPGGMTPWSLRMLDVFELMCSRLSPEEYTALMAALSLSPSTFNDKAGRIPEFEKALVPTEDELANIPAQIEAVRSLGKSDSVPAVKAPTLILSGDRDFLTPPSCGTRLNEAIPGSVLVRLDGGHAALMECIEEGVVHILRFLRGEQSA
jgi:pimeloyl-ACP methyl ester carboxylesterase